MVFTFSNNYAQQKDSLIKVTEGVYEITGFYCNISFLVTDDGVFLFDTGNYPESGPRIQEIIKSVTNKPILFIVYTHYHGDHTNGIASFPVGITIVGQKNTVTNLKNRENSRKKEIETYTSQADSLKKLLSNIKESNSPDFKRTDSILNAKTKKISELQAIKTKLPTLIIDNNKTLVSGKDTIQFIYPGKAHTDGDLAILIKTRKTMVMGDMLFSNCFPYIDSLGDVANWSAALKIFAKTDTKYFIPGHCNIANNSDVMVFANYLGDLHSAVKKMKDEGKSLEEIKNSVKLPAYDTFGFTFLRNQNIEGVYSQLK